MNQFIKESAVVLRRARRRIRRFAVAKRREARRYASIDHRALDSQNIQIAGNIHRAGVCGIAKAEPFDQVPFNQVDEPGLNLGQFVHDLDNLLMVIANRAALAKSDVQSERKCTRSILAIQEAARQALELSRLLRNIEAQSKVPKSHVNLTESVRYAVASARAWMPPNVALVEDLQTDSPVWIFGNSTQIQRVIQNLLSNALNAVHPGGRVVVSLEETCERFVRPLRRRAKRSGMGPKRARLVFSDNGIGMDLMTRDRVFEPGFSRRQGGGGFGVGMTIVADIVRDHCGIITLESSPGCGTQVGISFPIVRESEGE